MKKGFFIFLLIIFLCGYVVATAFSKEVEDGFCYTNFSKKELLKDLAFAEKQIFEKTYTSDTMTERLERLEIAVFGALQDGREDFRIKKLKKSVTDISSGGYGLNNTSKILSLAGNALGTASWAIGDMHNFSPYTNNRYFRNGFRPPYGGSHRLPPPPPQNYNPPPMSTNFMKNYSMGTSIKILDD